MNHDTFTTFIFLLVSWVSSVVFPVCCSSLAAEITKSVLGPHNQATSEQAQHAENLDSYTYEATRAQGSIHRLNNTVTSQDSSPCSGGNK
ncbi:hypothetical protein FA95DRAFT_716539 [Auriscalpium vulgare]|uniref:Uncharacterized protein n=1 Tax=Auriscalpium vulgare TaxID=40419 RepID=A0ACB8RB93_9AGAM|nr:hypothetical protein FA95DRAFT_716539 [Auriscalpium vulgare]